MKPDVVSRVFGDVDKEGGRSAQEVYIALLQLPQPQVGIKFELELRAPMWRLSAAAPCADEIVGALPCHMRISLPVNYPLVPLAECHGGSVDLAAPGALGREASRIVSRAAHAKLSELCSAAKDRGAAEYIISLVDWVESTELHELAAASCQPARLSEPEVGRIRAFVRFHHVASRMKREYMRLWAEDLGVGALLAAGQPAMLLAEGPAGAVKAFIDRATKMLHWGPTPCRLVGSSSVADGSGEPLAVGLVEVAEAFPRAVAPGGTYNGRDSVDFGALADALEEARHTDAARQLRSLQGAAFAHVNGRVQESDDGTGWVGYASPELELAHPLVAASEPKAPARRRWNR